MKRVLIIDDDVKIGQLLDFALQKAGFAVMVARDGRQGLELAFKQPPDVVVLDVMMPGMHGYELCRRLRADSRTELVKIIFLTARTQPVDERVAMEAGADRFLSKPVMPDELVRAIRSVLDETRMASVLPESEPQARRVLRVAVQPSSSPRGRLIACFSPSPGVGVTTLSVNLALALALSLRARVPLMELHATQGEVLPALGLGPESFRGNLRATGDDLKWDGLLQHLVNHPSGVRILPAPPPGSDVPPVLTRQAISLLLARFPLVMADAASELDTRVQSALLTADLILLLTTPEVPALRAVVRSIRELRALDYPDRQILLIVNNVQPRADIPIEQIKQGMERPIFAVIPYEPNMRDLVRAGRPLLVAQTDSPAAQLIGRLSMQIARGFNLSVG